MSKRVALDKYNWNRYVDFRSRNTADDLAELCAKYPKDRLKDAFMSPDKTGLCPLHWASIHNRSDLIKVMLNNGAPLQEKCRNKLFADGSSLHLAAINGSIEAAAILLDSCKSVKDWLNERDSEGQTALMRCASPRSKRLDTVRDLLRKNLWSLSGRPAEIALYLIHRGAKWRETDSIEGMNLMHFAIINDYDDIVNMLLVIDKKMASVPVQLKETRKKQQIITERDQTIKPNDDDEMESIELDDTNIESQKALLNKESRTERLIGKKMLPLQLAIINGRTSMINLLWSVQEKTASADSERNEQRLKSIIKRVYWINKRQLLRSMRSNSLKFLLAIDLTLITLVWMPVYLDNDEDKLMITARNGVFILSFLLTMALAFRVMLMNAGHLKRNESNYFAEMKSLIGNNSEATDGIELRSPTREAEAVGMMKEEKENSSIMIKVKDLSERVRVLCHKCRCLRRSRSRHCDDCNHCIQDFDHHCIYLSCCIGRKNRFDFFLMMLSLTLMAIYGSLIQTNSIEQGSWHKGWHLIGFIWIFKYVLIGGLSTFSMLKRAALGVTMYEDIRSNRIRMIFGSKGPPDSISKTHKYYSTQKGSFWRYSPNRFLTGDLPAKTIINNLREYASFYKYAPTLLGQFPNRPKLNR